MFFPRIATRLASALLLSIVVGACDEPAGPGEASAPLIALDSPAAGLVTDADSVVLSGVARDDQRVERITYSVGASTPVPIAIDPGAEVSFRAVIRGLGVGQHEIVVIAEDGELSTTATRSVTSRDQLAPELTLEAPANGSTFTVDSVEVRATARDERGVGRITYALNGGTPSELTTPSSREATFRFSLEGLREGANELVVLAYDAGGNTASARRTLNLVVGPLQPSRLGLRQIAAGLVSPVVLTAPTGDDRLFVVEQPGRIRIIQNGVLLPGPFLDIAHLVTVSGEVGLLGLAFHPSYAQNGLFYVYYGDKDNDTRVVRYQVSSDRNVATPTSAKVILVADQPPEIAGNHRGGRCSSGTTGCSTSR